jgi:hypothetical protein
MMDQLIKKLSAYFGSWSFGVLDGRKGRWSVPACPHQVPYLRAQNAKGRHILLKPSDDREPFYFLADDLTWADLEQDHQVNGVFKPGRLVVETSPRNYQMWIHSRRPLGKEEKNYWLGRLRSDPGCGSEHRWGRCPGFRNRKEKYADQGKYPLAKLVWIDWKNSADIPSVPITARSFQNTPEQNHSFPSPPRGECVSTIFRRDYERCDQSATDFAFILALLRRGIPEHQIRQRLLEERKEWTNHRTSKQKDDYFRRTLQQARQIVRK